jgi:hypothetical protein
MAANFVVLDLPRESIRAFREGEKTGATSVLVIPSGDRGRKVIEALGILGEYTYCFLGGHVRTRVFDASLVLRARCLRAAKVGSSTSAHAPPRAAASTAAAGASDDGEHDSEMASGDETASDGEHGVEEEYRGLQRLFVRASKQTPTTGQACKSLWVLEQSAHVRAGLQLLVRRRKHSHNNDDGSDSQLRPRPRLVESYVHTHARRGGLKPSAVLEDFAKRAVGALESNALLTLDLRDGVAAPVFAGPAAQKGEVRPPLAASPRGVVRRRHGHTAVLLDGPGAPQRIDRAVQCYCQESDADWAGDKMIQCSALACPRQWYHNACLREAETVRARLVVRSGGGGDWLCDECEAEAAENPPVHVATAPAAPRVAPHAHELVVPASLIPPAVHMDGAGVSSVSLALLRALNLPTLATPYRTTVTDPEVQKFMATIRRQQRDGEAVSRM